MEESVNPLKWRSLTIALDQGSDGWSACHYLRSQRVCCLPLFDASHRAWNDVRNALKESCWWGSTLSLVALCNHDTGPWRQSRFYEEGERAMAEFLRFSDVQTNGLYEEHRQWLLEDWDLVDRQLEEDIDEEVALRLQSVFKTKLGRVGLARWFGVFESVADLLPRWTGRCLAFSYLCVQRGLLEKRSVLQGMTAAYVEKVGGLSDGDAKETTS
eukprot:3795394-Amphidinium_carterae.1